MTNRNFDHLIWDWGENNISQAAARDRNRMDMSGHCTTLAYVVHMYRCTAHKCLNTITPLSSGRRWEGDIPPGKWRDSSHLPRHHNIPISLSNWTFTIHSGFIMWYLSSYWCWAFLCIISESGCREIKLRRSLWHLECSMLWCCRRECPALVGFSFENKYKLCNLTAHSTCATF